MRVDTRLIKKQQALFIAKMRARCLGCKDCKGPCPELLQMRQVPEILLERREART